MGLFESKEEKLAKKKLKEEEKERKRKEFEKIMASNPTVTPKTESEKLARCPKCNSTSLTANKKGFSVGKAVVGGVVALPLGLVTGMVGKNKVFITCLNCGHKWKPGKF